MKLSSFPFFPPAPDPFPSPPRRLSASSCLCRFNVVSEDHIAESSVTMFGRDICGGINPPDVRGSAPPRLEVLGSSRPLAEGLLFFALPLALPPSPVSFRFGVMSGVSDELRMVMKDAESASTESNKSAADGRDTLWAKGGVSRGGFRYHQGGYVSQSKREVNDPGAATPDLCFLHAISLTKTQNQVSKRRSTYTTIRALARGDVRLNWFLVSGE